MKLSIPVVALLLTAYCFPSSSFAVDFPTEQDVDRTLEDSKKLQGDGESVLLTACALGYASIGNSDKATASIAQLRSRYPSTLLLSLLEPGFLSMPCSECYGISAQCSRCGGKGSLDMMAGSIPSRCVVCGGSGFVLTGCKKCKGTNRDPMSREACALLYWIMDDDQRAAPLSLDNALYVKFISGCVSLARERMKAAVRITGCSRTSERDGSFCNVVIDGDGHHAEEAVLVFVTGLTVPKGSPVSSFAFYDGKYNYFKSSGDERIVDKLVLSPWRGIKSMNASERSKDKETVMGIPRSVYTEIKEKAENDYPGEYGMQRHIIKSEVNDYKALHPIK